MRDLRDPQLLGTAYLRVRALGVPIEDAIHMTCDPYVSPPTLADPSLHHLADHPDVHLLASGADLSDGAE